MKAKYNFHKASSFYTYLLLVFSLGVFHYGSLAAEPITQINSGTPTTILCLGDSITEGGSKFKVYRHPLYTKLIKSAYNVKFIGPKSSVEDGIRLGHAGYSGNNAQQIHAKFNGIYKKYPADIILIHSAHNYTQEQKPIEIIIASLNSIIAKAKKINPQVTILIARGITSGKLPKYSYIPKLNQEIVLLGTKLKSARIIIVDQDKDFNWKTDTVKDKVHPNALGAEKMANKWFESLQPILKERHSLNNSPINILPDTEQQALNQADKVLTYKNLGDKNLKMHIYLPKDLKKSELRPALLFIHGGGWYVGNPAVHALQSMYFAKRVLVTATISYRLLDQKDGAKSPADCLEDARSAMRYLREHSAELHINPEKILACGGSAGGHLASALATIKADNYTHDNQQISSIPNALILLYPAFELVNGWKKGGVICRKKGINPAKFSPALLVDKNTPPTLILAGSKDPISTSKTNLAFIEKMKSYQNKANFIEYTGKGHTLFKRHKNDLHFRGTLHHMEAFLKELDYLQEILAPPIQLDHK